MLKYARLDSENASAVVSYLARITDNVIFLLTRRTSSEFVDR